MDWMAGETATKGALKGSVHLVYREKKKEKKDKTQLYYVFAVIMRYLASWDQEREKYQPEKGFLT